MKLILLVYKASLEDRVNQILKLCKIEGYTKVPRIYGAGKTSGPRLGTHSWPGENSLLFLVGDEGTKERFLKEVKKLKDILKKGGLKAFVLEVEEVI